jgi:hypothetical protein
LLLPGDVTHYLVPMLDVARDFIDVLESRDLRGMIFLQTVVNAVQVLLKVSPGQSISPILKIATIII